MRELAVETRAAADASYGDFETVGLADAVDTLIWWETASPPARLVADANIAIRIKEASRAQTRPREHRAQPTRPVSAPAAPIAVPAGSAPVQTTLFGIAA